jgi:methylated-DNA-[protein]-cysteine S-methyltransferase
MQTYYFQTILGIIEISGDENGISVLRLTQQVAISKEIPTVLAEAVAQLKEYMAGERQVFDLKLNPTGYTATQQAIWKELLKIPYGTTINYIELAKRLGIEKAFRAVASGVGKNPILIIVPCHRVISGQGKLSGYAAGLWRKKWLLELENPNMKYDLF